jgi:hypothetical protein
MPLLRYFVFVGSALMLLLLAVNWLLPEVKTESVHADTEKPVIRISSIEKLPEKVDFDTNSPTIVPSPTMVVINPPVPQSAFVFVQITPGALASFSLVTRAARTAGAVAKPHTTNKIDRRPALPNINATTDDTAPAASVIRLSLIDAMRSQFGQSFFKLN